MLAAAVVPCPPLLVPALATGAAESVAPLLRACELVVDRLIGQAPSAVVLVGPGQRTTRRRARDWGTLAGFGVAVEAPSQHDHGRPHLPLSLTIGRWLLERVGWPGAVVLQEVAADATPAGCAALGAELAAECGPRAAWLTLGDASTCRGVRAPGFDDPRAEGFDAGVAAALAAGDPAALLGLDVALAAELGAAGRPAWQVLAGATGQQPEGGPVEAALHYDAAPFGVGYLVAQWRFGS